ncbi:MAG: hypothetical protein GY910_13020 [bacterium]|nr:hypothetical protein [bacterium]
MSGTHRFSSLIWGRVCGPFPEASRRGEAVSRGSGKRGRQRSRSIRGWISSVIWSLSGPPRRKLVVDALIFAVVAYHDLIADPGEQHSLPLDRSGLALQPGLLAKISQWVGVPLRLEPVFAVSAERRRQIEALGDLGAETSH